MSGTLMSKLTAVGLAVLVVGAFACSTAPPAKHECPGCRAMVDQTCPQDDRCAACDACTATCGGCGRTVKRLEMCPMCRKRCPSCDRCSARRGSSGRETGMVTLGPRGPK